MAEQGAFGPAQTPMEERTVNPMIQEASRLADRQPVTAMRQALAVISVVIGACWVGTSTAGAAPADGSRPPSVPTPRLSDLPHPDAPGPSWRPNEIGAPFAIGGPGYFTAGYH